MFIRRTRTRSTDGGKVYFSYRLVRSERSGERVRQRTLLNLGSDFAVAQEEWPVFVGGLTVDRPAGWVGGAELYGGGGTGSTTHRHLSRAPGAEGGGGDCKR